jgi:catechol 2,3-dioxygenase-like lactoylglutathione lyase family enzyme
VLTAANLVAFVPIADLERARGFYEDTLALTLIERTDSSLIFETRGTELRLTVVEGWEPAGHTVLCFDVADAAHAAAGLLEAGVELERFDGYDQDDLGVWDAPGGARIAWFRDPDGNLLSIAEE